MNPSGNETIAAIATGAGRGVGIVRISGPEAPAVATRVFRGRGGRLLAEAPPQTLVLGTVVDPVSGEPVDEAFAVHMRSGRSYTGEPTVEIQCHGGAAVLDAVLDASLRGGARLAEPGEFTKRAFLHGRIDLPQAEAVAELIAARTEAARRSALARLQGALGTRVRDLSARLLDQVAAAEAILDHGDEELDGSGPDLDEVGTLARKARELVALGEAREARDAGPRVVIAGRTNAGKSSLFNRLCESDRSIVSRVPGTTRDYVEERSAVGGVAVTLIDTAGLREVVDEIESEGIRRSRLQMRDADLLILTIDASRPLAPEDLGLIDEFRDRSPLVVLSKADLPAGVDGPRLREACPELEIFALSSLGGQGCPELSRAIACRVSAEREGGGAAAPNRRHREALLSAAGALEEAGRLLARNGTGLDLAAAELRRALASFGELTGETTADEVVDRIFSRFCLGK